jgi:hypothetical protein
MRPFSECVLQYGLEMNEGLQPDLFTVNYHECPTTVVEIGVGLLCSPVPRNRESKGDNDLLNSAQNGTISYDLRPLKPKRFRDRALEANGRLYLLLIRIRKKR